MLAGLRVVLANLELFRFGARILLGHIEVAGVGGADEADLQGCWLCHLSGSLASGAGRRNLVKQRANWARRAHLSKH